MGESTKIEWANHSLNFWIGCTNVSAACDHCYAERLAKRFGLAEWGHGAARVKVKGAITTAFKLDRKAAKAGRRATVFCNSMSDFFDAEVSDEWRDEAMAIMALTPNLTWLVLTKRAKVMREYFAARSGEAHLRAWARAHPYGSLPITQNEVEARLLESASDEHRRLYGVTYPGFPLPNVRLGTSIEDQKMADLRIPDLLATPAAGRFVSVEPMLSGVILPPEFLALGRRAWVICGGESGPQARPMHPDWARSIRDQCVAAGVPFFFKQYGEWQDGSDYQRPGNEHRIVYSDGRSGPFTEQYARSQDREGLHNGYSPTIMARVGKARAGRRLDGREWSEVPG